MKHIHDFAKKKVKIEELQEYFEIEEYDRFYDQITEWNKQGLLKPVKASGLNGKKPPLYKVYNIQSIQKTKPEYLDELNFELYPGFSLDYYKKHMETYEKDRENIFLLSNFLKNAKDFLAEPASINERSFEIFRKEKYLEKQGGKKLLENLGLSLSELNIYETREPMAYYSHHKKVPQTILIIENEDTFYSMRQHLLSGAKTILGEEIGTVIYGKGKQIYSSSIDFTISVEAYIQDTKNKILYFGDLDYEGIGIYEKLAKRMEPEFSIKPFKIAYEHMIAKALAKLPSLLDLPITKEGQNRNIGTTFFSCFSDEIQLKMLEILKQNRYIPQEILQIRDF